MNEVQAKLLDLAVEVCGICKENDIPIVLCGGNALGLERNGGFLPWDDDIDLFITREGFAALDRVLSERNVPDRAWVTEERYPGYSNPLPRYVDTSTTLLSRSRIYDGTPLGEMVEFFVLDPYPNDPVKQREYQKYLWLYCELQASRFVLGRASMPMGVVDEELYRHYANLVGVRGKQAVLAEIERNYLCYDEKDCDWLCARWGVRASVVRKSWMDDIVYRPFEGKMLPFFKENVEYLYFTEYGYNWTRIPAKQNVVTHNTLINLGESSNDVLDDIREYGNEQGYDLALKENKADNLELLFLQRNCQREASVQIQAFLQVFANELGKRQWVYDSRSQRKLEEEFEPFIDKAVSPTFARWGLKVKVNDDLAETMLKTLIEANAIARCSRFIEIVDGWDKAEWYSEAIGVVAAMKTRRYSRDAEGARRCVDELVELYGLGTQVEVERTRAWLASLTVELCTAEDIEAFRSSLDHGDDPDIIKYCGDMYYALNDIRQAAACYELAKGTRNGVVRLEMSRRGFYC